MANVIYLRDDEVARIFRITVRQLQNLISGYVRGGNGSKQTRSKIVRNIIEAEPESIGGWRYWRVDKLAKILELSEEQIITSAKG